MMMLTVSFRSIGKMIVLQTVMPIKGVTGTRFNPSYCVS